ncbi:N-acetyltransferase [Jannaschia sp.]|nr:N-acetyltransferase [Jannaschia sp.]
MIRATDSHHGALARALSRTPHRTMFLAGNLAEHGVEGTGHSRATTYWIDDAITPGIVLGLTEYGMVLIEAPDDADLTEAAACLRGRALRGVSGPAGPAGALMRVADLEEAPTAMKEDEPQFLLDLADLQIPDGPGVLGAPDRDVAAAWRLAYERELGMGGDDPEEAAQQVDDWMAQDRYRMLHGTAGPLALTGFNAALPEIVQIGGVYTPPALRGRRLAGRAVALHLAEARARGVTRATLFAASKAAMRAYRPLGFRPVGAYSLILFDAEVTA